MMNDFYFNERAAEDVEPLYGEEAPYYTEDTSYYVEYTPYYTEGTEADDLGDGDGYGEFAGSYYGEDNPYYGESARYYREDDDSIYREDAGPYYPEAFDGYEGDGSLGETDLDWVEALTPSEPAVDVDYAAGIYATFESTPFDEAAGLAEGLRDVLHESYEAASPEEMQEAMYHLLEGMTPAEGLDFTRALNQISRAGRQVLNNPAVAQAAGALLPTAGAALGTAYGGPLGTAIGGQLGQTVAGAFTGGQGTRPATPQTTPAPTAPTATAAPSLPTAPTAPAGTTPPAVAPTPTGGTAPAVPRSSADLSASPNGGSAAATRLFKLTQNKEVLESLMALGLGTLGRTSIQVGQSGKSVPVTEVVRMLSTLAGQAAEDAEALSGMRQLTHTYGAGSYSGSMPAFSEERTDALYETLTAADHARMEAIEPWPSY